MMMMTLIVHTFQKYTPTHPTSYTMASIYIATFDTTNQNTMQSLPCTTWQRRQQGIAFPTEPYNQRFMVVICCHCCCFTVYHTILIQKFTTVMLKWM